MKNTIYLLIMSIYMESFSAVLIIRDQPIPLEYTNELYYWPLNLDMNPGTKNLFITMDGVNKVCFLNTAPSGILEQISEISIIIKGQKTNWNCFPYTTTIHEARP